MGRLKKSKLISSILKMISNCNTLNISFLLICRVLDKFKIEERSLKRNVESLNNEVESKRKMSREYEDRIVFLGEEVASKQRELERLEHLMVEYLNEKESYRQNKIENAHLIKEVI